MQAPLAAGALNAAYKNKIVSAADAVQLIHDGDTVATGGFVGIGFAESIAVALAQRWESTQTPRDLTLVEHAAEVRKDLPEFDVEAPLVGRPVAELEVGGKADAAVLSELERNGVARRDSLGAHHRSDSA